MKTILAALTVVGALALPSVAYGTVYNGSPDQGQGQYIRLSGVAAKFYPYVVDGYKDKVRFEVWMADPTVAPDCDDTSGLTYTAQIVNAKSSAVVRTLTWTDTTGQTVNSGLFGAHTFAWGGRKTTGAFVNVGAQFLIDASVLGTCAASTAPYTVSSSVTTPALFTTKTGFVTTTITHDKVASGRRGVVSSTGPCVSHPDGSAWLFNCSNGGGGFVTYAHRFPAKAIKGTRGMLRIWFYHHGPVAFGKSWAVGRTVFQNVRVGSYSWAEFTKVEWQWKTHHRRRI